ncbi:MAG TPA: ATP-grasp domain-containing protein [Terriglobales bacterium]|jgi:biotin carboxylase|nr:ATP-grasp domain-containing protein [Terriglobales bacterium]
MKRLLLLSSTTGYQAQQFRAAAERIGLPLVLATDSCHALDDPWGDGAISIRFQKPRESAGKIREFAQHHPIQGVTAIGDGPTATAALVARDLRLRFHPPEGVELCHNKFLARERYKQAGMRVPWYMRFKVVSNPAEVGGAVPYPCVLKPLGLSASRGVIRANNGKEFVAAFRRIVALLQQKEVRVMRDESAGWIQVESFIPGREVAVEGLVTAGRLRVLAIFDKPDPLDGPFFEETIYVTPSRFSDTAQQSIIDCTEQAVSALGLTDGPIHAELRVNSEGPWMLEIAARPIGGLCAGALRFQCDGELISLEELILRHASGENVGHMSRESCASGVMMIPIPHEGIYEGVENVDAARQVPDIERVEITAKLRQKLVPLPEGASYLGFIFARAPDTYAVEAALRESHRRLRFLISSAIPVV